MADLSIRQVAAKEAEVLAACAHLSVTCFQETSAQQWKADQLAALLPQNDNALFAGFLGDQLVAFALFAKVAGEGELLSICSDPTHRRAGHAKALLAHAIKVLGTKRLILEVAADNPAAIGLYRGVGFAETGRRKGYYTGPDGTKTDAVVMVL